jgi:hypothetical protein
MGCANFEVEKEKKKGKKKKWSPTPN